MSRYVILPAGELTQQMVDDCVDTSLDSVRKNNDNTKAILEYEEPKPASISAYTDYSHSEIIALVDAPESEWYWEL